MPRVLILLVICTLLGTQMVSAQPKKPATSQSVIEGVDKNKDGYVDREEYLRTMSDGFFFLDTNKDGFLTMDEIMQDVQGVERRHIQAADTNGDGKLTIYEFHKALSHDFDAADTNLDGVLNHNEIKNGLSLEK